MSAETSSPPRSGFGVTERKDAWWVGPLLTALGLGSFGIYATYRALSNQFFLVDGAPFLGWGQENVAAVVPGHSFLLSPFYSPLLIFPWMPAWLSPAFFILWAPGGFRLTCYYYRKAYYRAFFMDPPACAVGEPRTAYSGETRLFLFQNLHRFFMYLAIIFVVILSIDVVHAATWPSDDGGNTFGISVGTLVLATSTILLALYTFSCHSLRHLIGGNVDCYSCVAFGKTRHKLWTGISRINTHHMLWAWLSLFAVGLADFYVYLVASGAIQDYRIF